MCGLVRTLSPHYKNSEYLVAKQQGDVLKDPTKYLIQNCMSETRFSGHSSHKGKMKRVHCEQLYLQTLMENNFVSRKASF